MTLAVLASFIALQLAIGVWASRRVRSEADFFIAGGRLGVPLLTMSLFATWFGAESCLGASGAVYTDGLTGGRADPLGYALCLLCLGLFLARRLAAGGFLTLGDLYQSRYGVSVARFGAILLVPSSLIWGAAQVRAFGEVLAHLVPLSVESAIVVSGVIAIGYTLAGGLWGDVVTDLVQGIFLCVGLLSLFSVVLIQVPSWDIFQSALSAQRLEFFPRGESLWAQVDRFAVPILGSLVTQELAARVFSARSPQVARRGALWAALLYMVIGSIPVLLGLLGPALLPDLSEPERLLPALASHFFSPLFALIFSCALLAAILSTIDSVLLSAAALLSHNLLGSFVSPRTDSERLWLGRILLVLSGGAALAMALTADGIHALVEIASSWGTAGILVITLAALYLPTHDAKAATAALVAGAIATPAARALGSQAPFLLSVAAALLAFAPFHVLRAVEARRAAQP